MVVFVWWSFAQGRRITCAQGAQSVRQSAREAETDNCTCRSGWVHGAWVKTNNHGGVRAGVRCTGDGPDTRIGIEWKDKDRQNVAMWHAR